MTGNIIGIVAQRLLRRLCVDCKEMYQADLLEKKLLGCDKDATVDIYKAVGCDKCYRTGYKGRLAIMEVLRIDNEIDDLIAKAAAPHIIEKQAAKSGFKTLADEGLVKIIDGTTSFEELSRIVDLTHRL